MTLASTTTKVSYNGDGSTTVFDVTFKFLQSADVKAILRSAAGAETVWAIDVDYSLSGAGDDSGGTLTATVAPASGATLIIKRDAAETQQTDLPTGGRFASEAVETALDKLTMLVQQLRETLGRAATLAESSTTSGLTLPEPEADRFLGWNAGGTDLENKSSAGGVTDHGALTGLADDDHTQYLPVDGSRAMTGALDMGSQAIANVGTVDGRDVSADGGKLDGIEAAADVTDATNVAAAGAVMDGDFASDGLMARTGAGAYASRTIAGTANRVTVTNGDGDAGNPTLDYSIASQAEAEAGTDANKVMTAQRVKQAIDVFAQPLGQVVDANTQSGTSYTLVLADKGKVVEMNNASANTLTVPPNSGPGSVDFPVNSVIHVTQLGAGQTTVAQGAGVTIRTPATLKLRAQYSTATLRKRGTDDWVLSGDLSTS